VTVKLSSLPEGATRKIRVREATQLARWSDRTFYRHLPYFKTYLLVRPGKTRGTRLVDFDDFLAYLERHAQGLTNLETSKKESYGPRSSTS
jgi:hypothetical protein